MQSDPWAGDPQRANRHQDQRAELQCLCDALGASVQISGSMLEGPGGKFAHEALAAPLTRLPMGKQTDRPSLIDYIVAPDNLATLRFS